MSHAGASATLEDTDFILRDRGSSLETGDFIVGVTVLRDGTACFAVGDGTVRMVRKDGTWSSVAAHDGAVLSMAAAGAGVVTGGDDGRFCLVSGGTVTELATFGSRWVDNVAAWVDGKSGVLACSVGKVVHVFDGTGHKLKELAHPTTVGGLAIDAKGKRVAASHYNGVSLWFVNAKADSPRVLEWKGSHLGLAIHPGGDAVVSAMQENSLHGWRLADGQHMRMSGYPTKTASMSFSRTGKWLATSGAESVVLWPFFGGGPMGKAPMELAGGDAMMCTCVAFNPMEDMVAAGFADGLVVVSEISTEKVLPIMGPGKRGSVSALAWARDGSALAIGTETGFAALVDLGKR